MDILADPTIQGALSLVSDASKGSLSEKLYIVAIVWWLMGGKIKKLKSEISVGVSGTMDQFQTHFSKIEAGLNSVAKEVSDLKVTVAKDLAIQNQRLGSVENGLEKLNSRVSYLEKPKN
jgi:hypothetical protein